MCSCWVKSVDGDTKVANYMFQLLYGDDDDDYETRRMINVKIMRPRELEKEEEKKKKKNNLH